MPVPSAFDALPAFAGKRGAAIYRTRFQVPVESPAKIDFGAVSMWARVYVDGVAIGENACGYAPFSVSVPPSKQVDRELTVLVDNRFDFARAPMHEEYFDFYQYGGIIRDVTLHILPASGAFIQHLLVAPNANYKEGGVDLTILLGGAGGKAASVSVQFDHHETVVFSAAAVESGQMKLSLKVPSPRLWSPGAPHLHTVRVTLLDKATGKDYDDMIARFGLRRIEARDGALWLNGNKLKLRGYNRHEWHPNLGPCTPVLQMAADIQLLRDLGCNFVRGAHYHQDQRFLTLCDEYGLLVWEENLGWGQREKTFASAKFKADHAAALRSMILHSYNHPCIVIWGFLNEAGTDAGYVRPIFEESVRIIRSLDPDRVISYASMFALADRHYDLADLISLNIYPGWYNCTDHPRPLELIRPYIRQCLAYVDSLGFSAKPVIISEIGAEGLYGWHDSHHDFFTEEHQAAYLREACTEALANERCSGITLWQFSDVRTYGAGRSLWRPRTFNNKGTLDEYRRPKAAYQTVREIFRQT